MYKLFAVTIRNHSLNSKDISVANVDIFEKKQFSLQFLYSLLQFYIVNRTSFIFHLNVFLVSVCTRGFGYCFADRGEGEWDWYVRGDFRFMNFFTTFCYLIFLIFISFWNFFCYPRQLPTPTTSTHDPRPTRASLLALAKSI